MSALERSSFFLPISLSPILLLDTKRAGRGSRSWFADHTSGSRSTSSRAETSTRHSSNQEVNDEQSVSFSFSPFLSVARVQRKERIIKQRNVISLPSPSEMVQKEKGPHANPHEVLVVCHTTELTLVSPEEFWSTTTDSPTKRHPVQKQQLLANQDTLASLHCRSCGNTPGSTLLGGADPRLKCGS